MYLSLGMGNIIDIFTNVLLFSSIIFSITPFSKISNTNKNKMKFNILYLSFFEISSSLIFINPYTNIFLNKNKIQPKAIMSSNVYLNLNKTSKHDKELLKKLNSNNWSKSFIADIPINEYLNRYVDVTSLLFGDRSYTLIYNGWEWAIIEQNINNNSLILNSKIIRNMLSDLILNISTYKIISVSNKDINSINLIILNKIFSYFHEYDEFIKNTYDYNRTIGEILLYMI